MLGFRSYRTISLRRVSFAVVAAVALVGCSSTGTRGFARKNVAANDAAVERHVKRGYVSDRAYATVTVDETWTINGDPVGVSLMLPVGNDRFPLVVYLPGLGENAGSGLAWRKPWAEAGYAVLSVQPASEGVAVWESEQARLGDFQAVARAHFGASSLAARTRLLEGVFAELARRAVTSPFARVDMQAIAVTGFDLGAQAAMIVAGERVDGVDATHWPSAVKSVIAMSPYADFGGMGVAHDFEDIRVPVLGVTSGADTDAYGLVTSPSVRRAPYQYMPAGEKYLLVLAGAPHSLMSGGGTRETPTSESERGDDAGKGGGEQRSRNGMRGRRGSGGGTGGGTNASAPASASVTWKMEVADAQRVSTAFLDATVKGDPVAREWLQKDAQRWLGDLGQLSSK